MVPNVCSFHWNCYLWSICAPPIGKICTLTWMTVTVLFSLLVCFCGGELDVSSYLSILTISDLKLHTTFQTQAIQVWMNDECLTPWRKTNAALVKLPCLQDASFSPINLLYYVSDITLNHSLATLCKIFQKYKKTSLCAHFIISCVAESCITARPAIVEPWGVRQSNKGGTFRPPEVYTTFTG